MAGVADGRWAEAVGGDVLRGGLGAAPSSAQPLSV